MTEDESGVSVVSERQNLSSGYGIDDAFGLTWLLSSKWLPPNGLVRLRLHQEWLKISF